MQDCRPTVVSESNALDGAGIDAVALRSSGSGCHQWTFLRDWLSPDVKFMTPNLSGAPAPAHGIDPGQFCLAVEAQPIVEQLSGLTKPVHILGHSYGGALGVHLAVNHPGLVQSLCLYEPTCFSLLNNGQAVDRQLLSEIEVLAHQVNEAVVGNRPVSGAKLFTDFWGGDRSWSKLSPDKRKAWTDWVPNAFREIRALIDEPRPAEGPGTPTTLLVGSDTQPQTRRIAEVLSTALPKCRVIEIPGSKHLRPFQMREIVAGEVWRHLRMWEGGARKLQRKV